MCSIRRPLFNVFLFAAFIVGTAHGATPPPAQASVVYIRYGSSKTSATRESRLQDLIQALDPKEADLKTALTALVMEARAVDALEKTWQGASESNPQRSHWILKAELADEAFVEKLSKAVSPKGEAIGAALQKVASKRGSEAGNFAALLPDGYESATSPAGFLKQWRHWFAVARTRGNRDRERLTEIEHRITEAAEAFANYGNLAAYDFAATNNFLKRLLEEPEAPRGLASEGSGPSENLWNSVDRDRFAQVFARVFSKPRPVLQKNFMDYFEKEPLEKQIAMVRALVEFEEAYQQALSENKGDELAAFEKFRSVLQKRRPDLTAKEIDDMALSLQQNGCPGSVYF